MARKEPDAPVVRDPVVIDGRKHRIQKIENGWVVAKPGFNRPGEAPSTKSIPVDRLEWDKVAGLWRVRA